MPAIREKNVVAKENGQKGKGSSMSSRALESRRVGFFLAGGMRCLRAGDRRLQRVALRRQRPQVRILSGAPLLNKRENFGRRFGDAFSRAPRQNGFRPADADFLVGDPDFVHEQPGVGLPELRRPFIEFVPQQPADPRDLFRSDRSGSPTPSGSAVPRSPWRSGPVEALEPTRRSRIAGSSASIRPFSTSSRSRAIPATAAVWSWRSFASCALAPSA